MNDPGQVAEFEPGLGQHVRDHRHQDSGVFPWLLLVTRDDRLAIEQTDRAGQ